MEVAYNGGGQPNELICRRHNRTVRVEHEAEHSQLRHSTGTSNSAGSPEGTALNKGCSTVDTRRYVSCHASSLGSAKYNNTIMTTSTQHPTWLADGNDSRGSKTRAIIREKRKKQWGKKSVYRCSALDLLCVSLTSEIFAIFTSPQSWWDC